MMTENGCESPDSPLSFFYEEGNDIKIRQVGLVDYLAAHGYGKAYVESETSSTLVRVDNGVVSRTSKERIQDFVMGKVRNLSGSKIPAGHKKKDFEDTLVRASNVYFGSDLLRNLPSLQIEFNRDTRDESFFYFQNGFVRITAESITLRDYSEMDGAIWKDQVVDRKFEPIETTDAVPISDWGRFLWNVMGRDPDRTAALHSALGYLLHGYKNKSNAKAVVFLDEAVSDQPSGRTGKSLVAQSLEKVTSVHRVDARNFSFSGQFSFQSIRPKHQVVDFNDASPDFAFEKLFSVVTDDMQVERKYQEERTIPFQDSPKILISTNYVIDGEGESFEDRVFQIEFSPHYNMEHRPVDDFGQRFFEDWDDQEWRRFDNLMMLLVQRFLCNGLQEYEHKNVKKRKLRQKTSRDFADWILSQDPGEYNKKELWRAFFRDTRGFDPTRVTSTKTDGPKQKQFTRWCNEFGRIYTGQPLQSRKSGSTRYITLPDLRGEENR